MERVPRVLPTTGATLAPIADPIARRRCAADAHGRPAGPLCGYLARLLARRRALPGRRGGFAPPLSLPLLQARAVGLGGGGPGEQAHRHERRAGRRGDLTLAREAP